MRYRFLQTGRQHDERGRQDAISRIDRWWEAFATRLGALDDAFVGNDASELAEWMQEHLQAIDDRLMWEFGPDPSGGSRLVITPEADRELHPLVDLILQRSPGFSGWSFYPLRIREPFSKLDPFLAARGLPSVEGVRVVAAFGTDHRVDLEFHGRRFRGTNDIEARKAAFVATEALLGEETLNTWIGEISVRRGRALWRGAIPLRDLPQAVDTLVDRTRAGLPDRPLWQKPDGLMGTIWKLNPQKAPDYARQDDLLIGKSIHPAMWTDAHSSRKFDSRRFSRFGELFAYVKTDGTVDLSGERFADKGELEDALTQALVAREVGTVVGGGTGLRYSYVDLALTDPDEGIRTAIEVLREGNMVKETWIQFFDARYAHEWVGVWDESPTPPGMPHE